MLVYLLALAAGVLSHVPGGVGDRLLGQASAVDAQRQQDRQYNRFLIREIALNPTT